MKYTTLINNAGIINSGFGNGRTDLIDWAIIDYIQSWQTSKTAVKVGNMVWISYKHLIDEMPLLGLNTKSSVSARIKKLKELGLIETYQNDLDYRLYAEISQVCFEVVSFKGEVKTVHSDKPPVHSDNPPVQSERTYIQPSLPSNNDTQSKATAKLEIENAKLQKRIAELEKKSKDAVAAKSENKNLLPNYQKQTNDEIAQGQAYMDGFVNDEPFTPPVNPNEIILTPEQLECFQWAMGHNHWQQFAYSKSVFLKTLNNANGGMRNQYATFKNQRAQKSLAVVTSNAQGSNIIPFQGENNYVTQRPQQQPASATRQIDAGLDYLQHRYDTTGQLPSISDDF